METANVEIKTPENIDPLADYDYSIEEMQAMFSRIHNPADWKASFICHVLDEDLELARQATLFFTATELEDNWIYPEFTTCYCRGYRQGPAGDH